MPKAKYKKAGRPKDPNALHRQGVRLGFVSRETSALLEAIHNSRNMSKAEVLGKALWGFANMKERASVKGAK